MWASYLRHCKMCLLVMYNAHYCISFKVKKKLVQNPIIAHVVFFLFRLIIKLYGAKSNADNRIPFSQYCHSTVLCCHNIMFPTFFHSASFSFTHWFHFHFLCRDPYPQCVLGSGASGLPEKRSECPYGDYLSKNGICCQRCPPGRPTHT